MIFYEKTSHIGKIVFGFRENACGERVVFRFEASGSLFSTSLGSEKNHSPKNEHKSAKKGASQ